MTPLMNEENEQGGGGGAGEVETEQQKAPTLDDLMARIDKMAGVVEKTVQIVPQLQQQIAAQSEVIKSLKAPARAEEPDESEELEDPRVKRLEGSLTRVTAQLAQMQNRQDVTHFSAAAQALELTPEQQQEIINTQQNWTKAGFTMPDGQPWSLVDVTRWVVGGSKLNAAAQARMGSAGTEEQIQEANQQAGVERPGKSKAPGGKKVIDLEKDIDGMSDEQLFGKDGKSGIFKEILDSNGGW